MCYGEVTYTRKNEQKNNSGTGKGKDIISEIKEEFKRHTNILTEQIKTEVKTVAEGHSNISRKLEEHDSRFTDITSKLEQHDIRFTKIESGLTSVKSELNSVKMAVMDVNRRVGTLEEKVTDTNRKLNTVEEKLDKNLDNQEKRLIKLEEKVVT